MNGFDKARTVEALALVKLLPFIEESADNEQFVVTDKGRLAPFLQEFIGDVLMNREKAIWSIEIKAEQRWTGNLFLETWSNKNLENAANHARLGSNPGWLLKSRADLLFYYFLDRDALLIMSMLALQRWAFTADKIYQYREVRQGKYQQPNDTHGRIVPICDLAAQLVPPVKRFSVSQLTLKLEKDDFYNAADDFARSFDDGYAAIRARKANGGAGWEPKS
jgi:hypothetical protein